jgi:hypothetical protein
MHLIQIFLISILFINTLNKKPDGNITFIPPLKIPLALSANFGELRIDHFHSGVDIKTQGASGKEVVAAAAGYVYRISVSPGGFGKALYIKHLSGYSTVYGHLDKFIPEIEEYVVSRQYEEKSFMVTLWPPKERFRFNQGDLIAYSGNSGSSSGPHLHYEIRKSDEEVPVNPLQFEFGIEDNIKPVIEKLAIYPIGQNTLINNQNKALKINTSGSKGRYYIPSVINISGTAGFGLKSYDQQNGSNKSSVYSIELVIDSQKFFNYRMDAFSFNESRYVNSHIDYETFIRDNIRIERAFILPNDKLGAYTDAVNRGVFNFNDDKKHHVELIVTDISKNRSSVSFYVKSSAPDHQKTAIANGTDYILMPHNRNNKFVSKEITVNIPSGSLYDTLWFVYQKVKGSPLMYSDVYHIHNSYTPVHRAYSLSIKPGRVPSGKESKMLIVQLMDDNQKIPLGGTWENGYLTASPNSFGNFFVGIDTVAPSISSNGLNTYTNLSDRNEIRFRVTDNFSGIKSYEPVVDNKWALFEYDQKNEILIYKFDPQRIAKGKKHSLSLTVTDNRNNVSKFTSEFTW